MPKPKRPLNTVLLIGRVCKIHSRSTSQAGKPMLTLALAVDRPNNMPQKTSVVKHAALGEIRRIEPDFPVVVIEGILVQELADHVQVGTTLFVRGIFQTRNVDDHSTQPPRKRMVQEVLSNDARVLETPAERAEAQAVQRAEEQAYLAAPGTESAPLNPGESTQSTATPVSASPAPHKKKKKKNKKANRVSLMPTPHATLPAPVAAVVEPNPAPTETTPGEAST